MGRSPISTTPPKINCFSTKSFLALCFFLHFFCWSTLSFAKFPEYVLSGLTDRECGTLKDPNYRAAFFSLQDAINFCFLMRSESGKEDYPFPKASDEILDSDGYPVFHYEGSLFWETYGSEWTISLNDFFCKRIIRKAVSIDIQCMVQSDKPASLEEEQVFTLYKDYSSLLSVFYAMQDDAAFIYQNNIAFLRRRIEDINSNYYYRPSSIYGYVSLRVSDLQKSIKSYSREYQKNCQRIKECKEEATFYCKRSLDYCIAHHHNLLAYINRGLFDYLDGNVIDALDRIDTAFKKATAEELEALKTNALLLKGRSELEAGLYADSILTLSELIDAHPNHKDAYFERASAYFELGNFDLSLKDYLVSQIKPERIPLKATEVLAFSLGLATGIVQGAAEAGVEFIPSVLSSLQGISHGLWAFAQDPVQISKELVQASQDCINFIRENTPQETVLELVPELKELIEKWDQWENEKKGKVTGHIIGKYGVDIFIATRFSAAMNSFRMLKRANNLLTFEAMAISKRNQSLIKLEAAKRAQARKEILKSGNLKIQPDKQGKHLVGHKNYVPLDKKSILMHPNPQKLADEFVGTGIKAIDLPPGTSGYQEIVNFGEFIGYSIDRDTGEKIATSWGKIHYAKDGIHIVPTRPRK